MLSFNLTNKESNSRCHSMLPRWSANVQNGLWISALKIIQIDNTLQRMLYAVLSYTRDSKERKLYPASSTVANE